jgi:hypothetical protein
VGDPSFLIDADHLAELSVQKWTNPRCKIRFDGRRLFRGVFVVFKGSEGKMEHCVIVRASGRRLDQLREEASRISRGSKIDWWIERGDKTRFCFKSEAASKAFERMIASASERA